MAQESRRSMCRLIHSNIGRVQHLFIVIEVRDEEAVCQHVPNNQNTPATKAE